MAKEGRNLNSLVLGNFIKEGFSLLKLNLGTWDQYPRFSAKFLLYSYWPFRYTYWKGLFLTMVRVIYLNFLNIFIWIILRPNVYSRSKARRSKQLKWEIQAFCNYYNWHAERVIMFVSSPKIQNKVKNSKDSSATMNKCKRRYKLLFGRNAQKINSMAEIIYV